MKFPFKFSHLFVILTSALFAGCVSHSDKISRELSAGAAVFVNKSTDELLLKKGPPDVKAPLSNGDQIWTYRSVKTGEYRGATMTIGNAGGPPRRPFVSWRENTNFVISKDGFIKDFIVTVE